ncbi:hypothetical protein ACJZ2D_016047 [Fusarium nematophilum]
MKSTSKVRDTARQLKTRPKKQEGVPDMQRERPLSRNRSTDRSTDRPAEVRKNSSGSSSDGRAMLQKVSDLLGETRRETKWLNEALREQIETTRELKDIFKIRGETMRAMDRQMVEIKHQMTEGLEHANEQLETIATNVTNGSQWSYADVSDIEVNCVCIVVVPPLPGGFKAGYVCLLVESTRIAASSACGDR